MSAAFRTYGYQNRPNSFAALGSGVTQELIALETSDGASCRGMLYLPSGPVPRTVVHVMHPKSDFHRHYAVPALVEAGLAVFAQNSRWVANDVATIHELLLLDVAAAMRHLREDRGFRHVILLGNSGGGSLDTFYQAQACLEPMERLAETPAGDPVPLATEEMPPADGIVYLAAHHGQGLFLLSSIDPSVLDEADPLSTDPELDAFDPRNGYVPPPETSRYEAAFITKYRAAQRARVHRIDEAARRFLDEQRFAARTLQDTHLSESERRARRRQAALGRVLTVYRTDANPACLDLSLDPSERVVGSIFSSDPESSNYGEWGFGRLVTPRAWLSTWSGLSSNAALLKNIAGVRIPTLVIHYCGDRTIFDSGALAIHDASPSSDKSLRWIHGADHYGLSKAGDARPRDEALDAIAQWTKERFAP
jgi:hypothetical protein